MDSGSVRWRRWRGLRTHGTEAEASFVPAGRPWLAGTNPRANSATNSPSVSPQSSGMLWPPSASRTWVNPLRRG